MRVGILCCSRCPNPTANCGFSIKWGPTSPDGKAIWSVRTTEAGRGALPRRCPTAFWVRRRTNRSGSMVESFCRAAPRADTGTSISNGRTIGGWHGTRLRRWWAIWAFRRRTVHPTRPMRARSRRSMRFNRAFCGFPTDGWWCSPARATPNSEWL